MDNVKTYLKLCFAFFIIFVVANLSYGIYLYNKKGDTDKETNNNKKHGQNFIVFGALPIGLLLLLLLVWIGPHFLGI